MIEIEEALAIIQNAVTLTGIEKVELFSAVGRVLAKDLKAVEPSPRFTNSAMDGFALRWQDAENLPLELTIIGESRAGHPFLGAVKKGQAIRISTGAAVPEGADTVVPIEDCEVNANKVKILRLGKAGSHIRLKGEEIAEGDELLKKGTRLFPEHLALLTAQGIEKVDVYRKPGVALLTTGSEIKELGEEVKEYEIRDSNRLMLKVAIDLCGGNLVMNQHLEDDLDLTVQTLSHAAEEADLIILSGGVSVGPHDHVKNAAEKVGFEPLFWKIRQQPGKPFYFARKNKTLLAGLPGNPVSAFMGFVHYLSPLLRAMQGLTFSWPMVELTAGTTFEVRRKRPLLMRVAVSKGEFIPLPAQGSHMLTTISAAEGYIVARPGTVINKGEKQIVYLFPWRDYYGIY